MYHLLVLPILFIDWILLLVAKYHEFNIMEKVTFVILVICFIVFTFLYLHYENVWIF